MAKEVLTAKAEWVKCPGYDAETNGFYHTMRDGCYGCAPWWVDVPICPVHRKKLTSTGYCSVKTKVRGHFVTIGKRPE